MNSTPRNTGVPSSAPVWTTLVTSVFTRTSRFSLESAGEIYADAELALAPFAIYINISEQHIIMGCEQHREEVPCMEPSLYVCHPFASERYKIPDEKDERPLLLTYTDCIARVHVDVVRVFRGQLRRRVQDSFVCE